MGSDGSIIDPVWRGLSFLQNVEMGSPATRAKLLAVVANAQKKAFMDIN